MRTCEYDGCERETKSGKLLCPAHYMRKYRGSTMSGEVRRRDLSAREMIGNAAHRYVDAETAEEMKRAMELIIVLARTPRKKRRQSCDVPA